MNHINGDDPNIHHEPSDLLPADFLKMINELLERLHRAGHNNQGSKIEIVYVAPGGQHVETQVNAAPPCPSLTPDPSPKGEGNYKGRGKGMGEEDCKGRVKGTGEANAFKDDTPLSALFRVNFHEKLRKVIESWRPYLISDDKDVDALAMNRFEFDKKRIYSNRVYYDLLDLEALGALQVSLSQLACYLADHSNLSSSYTALYQQLKRYRQECQ